MDAAADIAAPIPVHVLTGFLGSGKTTLLNRLLASPALGDSAVIVNEFGEVAVDHAMVTEAAEEMVLLKSGCVCCSVRGDLVDSLSDLAGRRRTGAVPRFARVVVETTGLADPAQILQTLETSPALVGRFRAGAVTATVDAINGMAQLDRRAEARRQAAAADRIVLTKLDLAGAGAERALAGAVRRLNPVGSVLPGAAADADTLLIPSNRAVGPFEETDAGGHRGIAAHCIVIQRPLRWTGFVRWLDSLTALRGNDVLRIKGVVRTHEFAAPVAVNGIHHLLHPPAALDAWPDGRRETRLVVIADGLDGIDLRAGLEAAGA